MPGFVVLNILTSKWTYIIIAVLLALIGGILIWLGGYENPSLYVAGGGALMKWTWRYEWMQKTGLGASIASIILLFITVGLSIALKSNDSETYYDDPYAFQNYPPFASPYPPPPYY